MLAHAGSNITLCKLLFGLYVAQARIVGAAAAQHGKPVVSLEPIPVLVQFRLSQ